MATKKAAAKKAAPKKAATKKAAAKKEKVAEPELAIQLPAGTKEGTALTCIYSREISLAKGLAEQDDDYYGTFHGVVDDVETEYLVLTFVYPDGSAPTQCRINLVSGIDETFKMAIDEIKLSPIPKATLGKWKAAGEANAEDDEDEDEEDDDESGDDESEGGEVEYQ